MRKKSSSEWIEEINSKYLGRYTLLEFPLEVKRRSHLKFECGLHGNFVRTAGEVLLGKICPKCSSVDRLSKKFITSKDGKITKANFVHNNKYDYSLIVEDKIIGSRKYKIICPIHGEFEQVFDEHLRGRGCRKCSNEKNVNNPIEDKNNASFIHSSKYDYSLISNNFSIPWSQKQKIICSRHGMFEQIWNNHMRGYGCPKCIHKISSEEKILLEKIREFYSGESLLSYRPDFLNGKELDIFFPEHNLGIEINGLYWHSEKFRDKWYHFEKWKLCRDKNIVLLNFFTDDINNSKKNDIILSKIHHNLNLDTKIFARKCQISNIPSDVAISFCEENHIEGFHIPYADSRYVGLKYNSEIVMVAIYGRFYNQSRKSFEWKLQRIATKKYLTVVGGISKLSKYIKDDIGKFVFQVTLDSGGSLVLNTIDRKNVSLRYWWTDGHSRISRNSCQRSTLSKNEDWCDSDTEDSYMRKNKYNKIYDTGIVSLEKI